MINLEIFEPKARKFEKTSNIIIPAISVIEKKAKSLNGWELEITANTKYRKELVKDNIIAIKVKSKLQKQAFRIKDISMESNKIKIIAAHVAFDLENYIVEDVRCIDESAINAIYKLFNNADQEVPFTIKTENSKEINTTYFIRKNLLEALEIIEEKWKGWFDFDNYNITFKDNIGVNKGKIILENKKLKNSRVLEDWSEVCTKILPTGSNGLKLPEVYITSETQYDIPYTKTIQFNSNLENATVEEKIEELRSKAVDYLLFHKEPKILYEIDTVLDDTLEINEIITVKSALFNIKTEVLEYTCEYIEDIALIKNITFGNYKKNVKKYLSNINNSIINMKNEIVNNNNILEDQKELIQNLNKKGKIYITDNELYILDKFPLNEAKNVWRFGLGGISFSNTGVNGNYTVAITQDGKISADFIKTGEMSVDRITGLKNITLTVSQSVKTADIYYALSDSREVAPTTGWTEQAPLNTNGAFMWQKIVTTLNNGDKKESITCISGADGKNGKDGENGSQGPVGPAGQDGKNGIDGTNGKDGKNGIGIKSVDLMYYLSTSSTEEKDGKWETTAPNWEKGKYLWTKQVTTYTEGEPKETKPICVTGSDGKGIKIIVEQYCLSTSNTEPPIEGWLNYQEPWKENYYFWTRQQIIWEDDTTTITAPILALNLTDIERKTNENSKQMEIQKKQYSELDIKYGNIVGTVETNRQVYEQDKETLNSTISNLTERVDSVITPKQVELKIQEEIEKGVDKVKTSTGFTFDKDGLKVSKDGTEMSTQIKEDGMTVYRDKEKMLVANNQGVDAVNLHASTYLIIGNNSRFEDFEKYGKQMTGCFWIGKPTTRNLKEVNK